MFEPPPTKTPFSQYLGDAVYADYDGFHVILRTSDGICTTNTIALDPCVLQALIDYPKFVAMKIKEGEIPE